MSLQPQQLIKILVRQGVLTTAQADLVQKEARSLPTGERNARAYEQRAIAYDLVLRLQFPCDENPAGVLSEVEIATAIARDAQLEFVRIDPLDLDADLIESRISRPFAKRHRMLPLNMEDGRLRVACADPFDIESIDSFRRIVERDIELVVASEPDILKAINEFYGLRHSVKRAERDLSSGIDLGNLEALVRMKDASEIESSDQHIVNAVEFMLQHAYDTRSSDIHIEPKREESLVRFRIDGRPPRHPDGAQDRPPGSGQPDQDHGASRHRREAAPAGRTPQDQEGGQGDRAPGLDPPRGLWREGGAANFRSRSADDGSGVPRLLRRRAGALPQLHQSTARDRSGHRTHRFGEDHNPLLGAQDHRHPRAQYLHHRRPHRDGLDRVQPDGGTCQGRGYLCHRSASILRQDPDIIMVGEIRDPETSQYSIQAALTGHLVFSTLHTNDSAASVTRLADLEIERYLITSTLAGAMAQRLVRKVCPHCAADEYLTDDEATTLNLAVPRGKKIKVSRGEGCFECRSTGYFGRTGIFEVLPITDAIKQLVLQGADAPKIKREAVNQGMRTLRQSALRKLAEGVTTYEEVIRVTSI